MLFYCFRYSLLFLCALSISCPILSDVILFHNPIFLNILGEGYTLDDIAEFTPDTKEKG